MITRMVKMEFHPENVEVFIKVFDQSSPLIRAFDGCMHLELHHQIDQPQIIYTFSIWKSEEHLNLYRNSKIFKDTWAQTKPLFAKSPKAWSMSTLRKLP